MSTNKEEKSERFKNVLRRFKYYSVGLTIGILFVIFFFNNRGCSWTPNNRVKQSLETRILVANDATEAQLKEKGYTAAKILKLMKSGDVDFQNSQKQGQEKAYLIRNDEFALYFTLPNEAFISELFIKQKDKQKIQYTKTGLGNIVHLPANKDVFYVDSNAVLECQQALLKIKTSKDLHARITKSGKVDFEASNLAIVPKPEVSLLYSDKLHGKVSIKAIWYKDKINVKSFEIEKQDDCFSDIN